MSDKVFVVTSGEYSDYRIDAVFADRATAQAFCDRENVSRVGYGDHKEVEEWPLLAAVPEAYIGYHASATLEPDGTLSDIRTFHQRIIAGSGDSEGREGNTGRRIYVNYRRSEDEALKALRDHAAWVRARAAGVT